MSKERVGLVTYGGNPGLYRSDNLLLPALVACGIEAVAVPWDVPTNWTYFDSLILRSTWNYHHDIKCFLGWIEQMAREGIAVYNPPEIVRWNTDKHYLLDLADRGVDIVPTVFYHRGSKSGLRGVLEANNWQEGVVKPTIGASADGVARFTLDTVGEAERNIDSFGAETSWIIQEYRPEITKGEYSFVFFNREYSHTVKKTPQKGEYRVQSAYGGSVAQIKNPNPELISHAGEVLAYVDGPLLYARVDGIPIDGVFHLMELELTEPYLFLDMSVSGKGQQPQAPRRFVEAYQKLSTQGVSAYNKGNAQWSTSI